jgi:hypothetical protein
LRARPLPAPAPSPPASPPLPPPAPPALSTPAATPQTPATPAIGAAGAFSVAGFRGRVAPGFELPDLAAELPRLIDPAAAIKTLHWGRNYLYLARCDTAAGAQEVVVKQFRNRRWRDRLRRRLGGSKAAKSWRIAHALRAAGIATPEPLILADSVSPAGPSFYVCRFLAAGLEARYLLRAANAGRETELFPDIDLPAFLRQLGGFIRRLHDAGFWHRDLSSGNVLLDRGAPAAGPDAPNRLGLGDHKRAGRACGSACATCRA